VLVGDSISVSLTMPDSSLAMVQEAASDPTRRLFVSLDDIEAQQDPGLAYAVYFEASSGARQHIGNVAFFGIQEDNDPDRAHDGAPGLRHTFEATGAVDVLRQQDAFDPKAISVRFEPIRVLPPPGEQFAADIERTGPVPPVQIGRVSVFVA
jgi:hypothetical protein